jgi:hypothetical protein
MISMGMEEHRLNSLQLKIYSKHFFLILDLRVDKINNILEQDTEAISSLKENLNIILILQHLLELITIIYLRIFIVLEEVE